MLGMTCLTFKHGLHNACDACSSHFLPFGIFITYLFSISFLFFLPLILMQVRIIRDNLISTQSLWSRLFSVISPTPLFPSIAFPLSIFFFSLSLTLSLNSALASPMPLKSLSALSPSFFVSPSVFFSSPPASQWRSITVKWEEKSGKMKNSSAGHTIYEWALILSLLALFESLFGNLATFDYCDFCSYLSYRNMKCPSFLLTMLTFSELVFGGKIRSATRVRSQANATWEKTESKLSVHSRWQIGIIYPLHSHKTAYLHEHCFHW